MIAWDDINPRLEDLVYAGLEHGFNEVKDGDPLIPFAITDQGGEPKIHRFPPKDFSQMDVCIAKGLDIVSKLEPKPDFAVFVYEGYVTLDGTKSDAIIAKGYDKTMEVGVVLVQRYKPKAFLRKAKEIGNVIYFENEPSILG
jgi:hypothetical protein